MAIPQLLGCLGLLWNIRLLVKVLQKVWMVFPDQKHKNEPICEKRNATCKCKSKVVCLLELVHALHEFSLFSEKIVHIFLLLTNGQNKQVRQNNTSFVDRSTKHHSK